MNVVGHESSISLMSDIYSYKLVAGRGCDNRAGIRSPWSEAAYVFNLRGAIELVKFMKVSVPCLNNEASDL